MSGLCDRCMTRESRSAHDLYCDECENEIHHPDQAIATLQAQLAERQQRIVELEGERDIAKMSSDLGDDQVIMIRQMAQYRFGIQHAFFDDVVAAIVLRAETMEAERDGFREKWMLANTHRANAEDDTKRAETERDEARSTAERYRAALESAKELLERGWSAPDSTCDKRAREVVTAALESAATQPAPGGTE